jgi:hypothetical protein
VVIFWGELAGEDVIEDETWGNVFIGSLKSQR